MRNRILTITCFCLIGLFGTQAGAADHKKVKFILEIMPGSFLNSPDVDGFTVYKSSGWFYESEEVDGYASWMPNVRGGVSLNVSDAVKIDLTGGVGFVANAAFIASIARADVAARFNLSDTITLGPRLGLIAIEDELEWLGDGDVFFKDGGSGFAMGLDFTAGKRVKFIGSVSYYDIEEYTVTTTNGWVANADSIDLSGYAIELGVKIDF